MLFANVEVIFVKKQKYGGDYTKFGEFLKIDPKKIALALINHKDGSKFVLIKDPESLTVDDIIKFLEDWENKKLKRYELPDEIKEIKEPNVEAKVQNSKAE